MKKITTNSLDVAGFFYAYHAKLLGISGKYPRNQFTFEVPRYAFWLEKLGLINYKRFIRFRYLLKLKIKSHTPYTVHSMSYREGVDK